MNRLIVLLCLLWSATPASAQDRWTHAGSGATLPTTFEQQTIKEQRDLGSPNDSVVDYAAAAGVESTTLYIFRASVPNARIWFDRALPIVGQQIPMALFDAGPVERIAAFGAAKPNALRQVFTAKQAGPFKTTALVVAQSGPWIVKVRASSATLDRDGLKARIDRHLAAITLPAPTFPAALDQLAECKRPVGGGQGQPIESDAKALAEAAAAALVVFAAVHAAATDFCTAGVAPSTTVIGSTTQPTFLLMLPGDAGRAIGIAPVAMNAEDQRHIVFVSNPAGVRVAALYDGPPELRATLVAAAPLLRDPKAGLLSVGASAKAD